MSAAQDAARLVSLAVAHNDATETLLERTIAGTASPWDARAVTAAFDAMDATRHALKIAHFPDARAVFVDLGRVIVEHRDGRFERVATDEEA
ncbi:hypothetical protein FA951_04760 [Dermacoccus nishinomiyaensis]|uniref:hypothetical protein n=1 Tax=Dermacoccus TaxID=57495 RepID=UPI0007842568|nr:MULTISPECIES: hypothetical protein [Dermacoccus]MCT1605605.1 hypothetical protein [Dermacoccus nishinomiyaensis]TCJ91384.1 hypothetical protein EDC82_1130 [Dermacoccus sp. SAI-028]TJZ97783.1 hypothetical protein FA951_04760 [Dermacoccus nishinomiyaensis]